MTRNEVAVPETRQVSGVPDGLSPGLDGASVAGERVVRLPRSGVFEAGLGGAEFLQWGRACVAALERARAEIDALNVFPVPDSDTGRNLLATMRAAVAEAESVAVATVYGVGGRTGDVDADAEVVAGATGGRPQTVTAGANAGGAADGGGRAAEQLHRYAAAMARGAVSGARGNSGIILSQVLRGIAESAVQRELTGETYRDGLARAAALARDSLSEPVEGTVLTVLDRASDAARECLERGLAEVARAAADGAARALEQTRDQLAVLRAAGVVDAGARGLLVLLDTMVAVVTGEIPARREYPPAADPSHTGRGRAATEPMRYEVMFRIAAADDRRAAALRARLAQLGDSVIVAADGAGGWTAHVHCAEAGAAVEAGMAAGAVRDIRIEYLAESPAAEAGAGWTDRVTSLSGGRCAAGGTAVDRGVLAVAAGAGAAGLFEAAGAVVLDAEPALESAALLAAIRGMPHREVLVLPNGALPAHELVAVGVAARDAYRDVLLLPSASMVQGLAAMAVHDRARIAVDDAFAMSEAAAGTRWGSLRRAEERALTMVGTCAPGDGLGLVGHDVVVIDRDTRAAGQTLLDRMLGLGGELVTLLVGTPAPEGLAADLARHIGAEFPGVEVSVYSGGQRADLIQIGVE
ncbi:DAK2 domain-containing protein [Nocardia flavorosea]|uniref:DAK2 domain-containing protein n=1 Tax=Nocardia flavorosea TaxID=53429 RepID=UPI001892E741|nr:DAK2 domain-containing protein [Nocardia flavorosea]MBF6348939.1 DAK2 domain-containing protein [Nocardia flavorosea]